VLLEIFKDSFEYSYKDINSIFKLGIVSLLSMIFVFPILIVYGYFYQVIDIGLNGTINGDDPLPKFEDWVKMPIQGLKIIFVRFIYLIPVYLILIILNLILLSSFIGVNSMNNFPNLSILAAEVGIISLSIISCVALYLLSSVAITNMVNYKGSLKEAFNFKEIMRIIKSIGIIRYIKFYFGCIILGIGILGTALLLILLITVSLTFITWVITSSATYSAIVGGPIAGLLSIIVMLSLIPLFLTFESRAIALIYNMRELD